MREPPNGVDPLVSNGPEYMWAAMHQIRGRGNVLLALQYEPEENAVP